MGVARKTHDNGWKVIELLASAVHTVEANAAGASVKIPDVDLLMYPGTMGSIGSILFTSLNRQVTVVPRKRWHSWIVPLMELTQMQFW
jgi:hypothetical protein